jgi:hypothetical protein
MAFERINLDTTKTALSNALTNNEEIKEKFTAIQTEIDAAFGTGGAALAATLGAYSSKLFEGGAEAFYNLMQSRINNFLNVQVPTIINAQSEVASSVYGTGNNQ